MTRTMTPDIPPRLYEAPHWFACRTRARSEKKVDRHLESRGIPSYLPLLERERQWADRKKKVKMPVFPGYVFARFRLEEMGQVFRTPGLVTVVQMAGYPTPVCEKELESVRALIEGANLTGTEPHPSDYLVPGEEVEVVDGPFKGMRGVLLEVQGRSRVLVRLSAIRQAVGVQMERRHVRPYPPVKPT